MIEDICGTFWRIDTEWVSYECGIDRFRIFARCNWRPTPRSAIRNTLKIFEVMWNE